MTLLTTEIHNHDQSGAFIVFAADRRITRGTVRDSEQRKVFRVPGMHAGVGYFGLAEVPSSAGTEPMAEWLNRFLTSGTAGSLEALARELAAALNAAVPEACRRTEISGFHLCGLAAAGRPEFWYVRNCEDSDTQTPVGYYESREDFQARDAAKIPSGGGIVYRNGDIRAHVLAWEKVDEAFGALLVAPDFRVLASAVEYATWVKFKMEVIAQFYERFCKVSIIGGPVDAFEVTW